jgi:hypothetical protein
VHIVELLCLTSKLYPALLETGCLPFLILKANFNLKCLNGGTYPQNLYSILSQKIPFQNVCALFTHSFILLPFIRYISKFKLHEKKLLHTNSCLINRTTNTESNLNDKNVWNLLQTKVSKLVSEKQAVRPVVLTCCAQRKNKVHNDRVKVNNQIPCKFFHFIWVEYFLSQYLHLLS